MIAIRNLFTLAFCTLLLVGCATPPRQPLSVRLIGYATLPHKMNFQGTSVGGLSGIDYDTESDTYYLLSDDRSDNNPARFYTAKINYDEKRVSDVTLTAAILLKQLDGTPFPNKIKGGVVPDPESIRFRPDTKTLLWTSEGDKRLGLSPFIREMKLDGAFVREIPIPEQFMMRPPSVLQGPRDNLTFEGMTLSADRKRLWVALEAPLYEDGDIATVTAEAGPSRITEIDLISGKPTQQFVYAADAISVPPTPPTGFADNGIPEILMSSEFRMLVLERAFSQGVGNSIRVYETNVLGGSETLSFPSLRNSGARVVPKRLVVDFGSLGLPRIDNTEGMTWGKRLPNGNRSLVFVSDDNFSDRQITQFVVLEVIE